MKVTVSHKGKKSVRCHVHGLEAHSSLAPNAVNAVEYGGRGDRQAARHGPALRRRRTVRQRVRCRRTRPCIPASSMAARRSTSCPRTAISISSSAICRSSGRRGDARGGAGASPRGAAAGDAARSTGATGFDLAADLRLSRPLHRAPTARSRSSRRRSPAAIPPSRSPSAPRPGCISETGIPAIICGPGSIEQAHKPNEWVTLDQLAQCETFMRRLMDRVCERPA